MKISILPQLATFAVVFHLFSMFHIENSKAADVWVDCPFKDRVNADVKSRLPKGWHERTFIPLRFKSVRFMKQSKGLALACAYEAVHSPKVVVEVYRYVPKGLTKCKLMKSAIRCTRVSAQTSSTPPRRLSSPEMRNRIRDLQCLARQRQDSRVSCNKAADEFLDDLVIVYRNDCRESCTQDCVNLYLSIEERHRDRFTPACTSVN